MRDTEEIIGRILAGRGYETLEDIAEFLSDKPKRTYDPFLLPDMEAGVDFIYDALKEGKRICVYGDYDADGTLAAALLVEWLRGFWAGADVFWYIPRRIEEGYGLNVEALASLKEQGADLVITVDCGSVSKEEVAFAHQIGLALLVTDHHDCTQELLPDCLVINPKRADSAYPFSGLSGCGVAFKVAQGLQRRYAPEDREAVARLNRLLDLVAVATVADVMPLRDENRTLVKYGLRAINQGKRPAMRKLVAAISLEAGTISAWNIAFGIAPHINAAGRMSDAGKVVELFVSEETQLMESVVAELMEHNSQRRQMQDSLTEECVRLKEQDHPEDLFLLLKPEQMHEGVAGIVAGRLKDRYGLPVAVLSKVEGDGLKGSARSVAGLDIISLLREREELFLKLGGHRMAAGFTLPAAREQELRDFLNQRLQNMVTVNPTLLDAQPEIDMALSPEEASLTLAERLPVFEPTGQGNPRPLFLLRDVEIGLPYYMGTEGQHVRFEAAGLRCVLFGRAKNYSGLLKQGNRLTLLGNLEVNEWKGNRTVQLLLREVLDSCPESWLNGESGAL